MEKLVCVKGSIITYPTGKIFTVSEKKDCGYAIMHYLVEKDTWLSDTFYKSDFRPVKDITASVSIMWGDGKKDVRYFVDKESADTFKAHIEKAIQKCKRISPKYQLPEKTIIGYTAEYNIQYTEQDEK